MAEKAKSGVTNLESRAEVGMKNVKDTALNMKKSTFGNNQNYPAPQVGGKRRKTRRTKRGKSRRRKTKRRKCPCKCKNC